MNKEEAKEIVQQKIYGVKSLGMMIVCRAMMKGFVVMDYMSRSIEGLLLLNKWVEEGKIVQAIDLQEGFDRIPKTLNRIFEGKNIGKQLLKLSDPPLPLNKQVMGKFMFKMTGSYFAWKKGF